MNNFNNKIKDLRNALNLSQLDFANKLGLDQQRIAYQETDAKKPSGTIVAKIAAVFGYDYQTILNGTVEEILSSTKKCVEKTDSSMRNDDVSENKVDLLLELNSAKTEARIYKELLRESNNQHWQKIEDYFLKLNKSFENMAHIIRYGNELQPLTMQRGKIKNAPETKDRELESVKTVDGAH
jgi:transcriptional regulator with XRE-family HTH domain